jgi:signal transduction histidine kinase
VSDAFEAPWVRDLLHDLRGPLANARGFLDYARLRLSSGEVAGVADHLQRVGQGVDRALEMLDDLSTLHALRSGRSLGAAAGRSSIAELAEELRPTFDHAQVALTTSGATEAAVPPGTRRVLARLAIAGAARVGTGGRVELAGAEDSPAVLVEASEAGPPLEGRPVPSGVPLARCLAEALGLALAETYPSDHRWRIAVEGREADQG